MAGDPGTEVRSEAELFKYLKVLLVKHHVVVVEDDSPLLELLPASPLVDFADGVVDEMASEV